MNIIKIYCIKFSKNNSLIIFLNVFYFKLPVCGGVVHMNAGTSEGQVFSPLELE